MKILITGATGLVGTVLMEKAIAAGHSIHYLTTRKGQLNKLPQAKGFYWNPKTDEIDTACFDGVDIIVHLAGASISQRWTAKNKKEILDSRVEGTRLLFKGLETRNDQHQVKQVIAASAIGIYPSSFTAVYTEDYQPKPDSFLEEVVMAWEAEEDQFTSLGVGLCKLRIGLVLTKTGGVLGPLKIPTQFGLGAAFGNGKQLQAWIHVDDLVQMILMAGEKHWQGVYNAVSPNPVSQNELTKALAKAMRRPYFMPPLPKFLIRLVAGEMSILVFNSQQVSAEKVLNERFVFAHPKLETALQSLL